MMALSYHECQDCGVEYCSWFAPNHLWNRVMGGEGGLLCPTCFMILAAFKGESQVLVLTDDTGPHEREAELTHEVERLLAAGAWQPIETAPKDGTWVLTIGKNGAGFWTIPQTVRWTGLWESPVHDARVEVYHQPTHWMPLPPAPEQRETDD